METSKEIALTLAITAKVLKKDETVLQDIVQFQAISEERLPALEYTLLSYSNNEDMVTFIHEVLSNQTLLDYGWISSILNMQKKDISAEEMVTFYLNQNKDFSSLEKTEFFYQKLALLALQTQNPDIIEAAATKLREFVVE